MNILVLGRAKTGTTIIAKTIQNSLENASFMMEPTMVHLFLEYPIGNLVTKIIYEHWSDRPYLRLAIMNNELSLKFQKKVAIIRDPRDEMISRLFYIAYAYFSEKKVSREQLHPWLEIIKTKERTPQEISFEQMFEVLYKVIGIRHTLHMNDSFNYIRFLKQNNKNIFILRYEDFIENRLQPLTDYLEFSLTERRDVGTEFDRTRRSSGCNNWKNFFIPADLDKFKQLHGEEMEEMGYTDWQLTPTTSLNPEHGSLYLERILQEAVMRLDAKNAPDANKRS
ncbi:MAG: sulfotransferase domain-containing protein [Magnetococcus sp. DMHC-6]